MTNTIADIETSDLILVAGSNTTENHPVLSTFMKRAVLKGKKLVVIDPRFVKLANNATKWLRPNPGTDIAWINGLMHVIIEEDLHDKTFIADRTENFDALKDVVASYTPELVEEITGIAAQDIMGGPGIRQAPASICYCMGITHIPAAPTMSSPWPTCPCCAGIWANPAAVSIRCGGRTMSRGPVIWADFPCVYGPTRP